MPVTAAQREKQTARQLAALHDEFPGWDVRPVLTGWLAVPSGTTVIQSVDLDGVLEKLRNLDR
jgi:hypothetical protein